ncbi:unnamed protein product, partial [Ixodes pacificus]
PLKKPADPWGYETVWVPQKLCGCSGPYGSPHSLFGCAGPHRVCGCIGPHGSPHSLCGSTGAVWVLQRSYRSCVGPKSCGSRVGNPWGFITPCSVGNLCGNLWGNACLTPYFTADHCQEPAGSIFIYCLALHFSCFRRSFIFSPSMWFTFAVVDITAMAST